MSKFSRKIENQIAQEKTRQEQEAQAEALAREAEKVQKQKKAKELRDRHLLAQDRQPAIANEMRSDAIDVAELFEKNRIFPNDIAKIDKFNIPRYIFGVLSAVVQLGHIPQNKGDIEPVWIVENRYESNTIHDGRGPHGLEHLHVLEISRSGIAMRKDGELLFFEGSHKARRESIGSGSTWSDNNYGDPVIKHIASDEDLAPISKLETTLKSTEGDQLLNQWRQSLREMASSAMQ